MNRQIVVLFIAVFVSMTGVGLIAPVLPLFGERAGIGPELITFVIAIFSLGQFAAAPLWGWMSDRWGRKQMLTLSLLGSFGAYVILAFAESFDILLLSRLIGGVMAGNVAIAFAAVTDVTTPEDRPKAMGRLGAAFGLGFIVGPALGAALAGSDGAATDFVLMASVSGALNLIAAGLALVLLKSDGQTKPVPDNDNERTGFLGILAKWGFARLALANFLFFCAVSMFESTFALMAYLRMDMTPAQVGLLFTFLAVSLVTAQTTAVGPAVKAFGNMTVMLGGAGCYAIGLSLIGFAPDIWMICAGLFFCALGNAGFIPTSTSMISEQVPAEKRGAGLGLFQATGSLGRALPPLVSGLIFSTLGMNSPIFIGAGLVLAALAFLVFTSTPQAVPVEGEPQPADK